MSDTPARDAWVELAQDNHHSDGLVYADTHVDASLARPDLVVAALIESGWTPTDGDLRAMGGKQFGYAHRSNEGALEHSFLYRDSSDARPVWWFPKERA